MPPQAAAVRAARGHDLGRGGKIIALLPKPHLDDGRQNIVLLSGLWDILLIVSVEILWLLREAQ